MSGFQILSVIDVAIKWTSKLAQYTKEFKMAPADMRDLLNQVEQSRGILQAVQSYYNRIPEEQKDSDLDKYIETNVKAYSPLFQDLHNFVRGLGQDWLRRSATRSLWLIKKDDFHSRFAKIQKFESKVKDMRQFQIEKDVRCIKDSTRFHDFQRIIEYLAPANEFNRLEDLRTKHRGNSQKSPPEWICATDVFRRWVTQSGGHSAWLWGVGEAGSGKSCISSFLADKLQIQSGLIHAAQGGTRAQTDWNFGVAVFYCSYKSNDRQDSQMILKCLSRQLLTQLQELKPTVASKRIKDVEIMISPGSNRGDMDPAKLLDSLCSEFEQSYIIIDALDEYPSGYEYLLTLLRGLKSKPPRIFLTSRVGLRDAAEGQQADILDVTKNDEVIKSYVSGRLHRIAFHEEVVGSSVLSAYLKDEQRRNLAAQKLIEAARNNFLCAELQIAALKYADSEDDLAEILSHLKGTVEELVIQAIDRVRLQSNEQKSREGMKVLMWAIYSNESLTLLQLQHAMVLALYPGRQLSKHNEQMKRFNRRYLIESTGHLLDFEGTTKSIQVHKAIRDYCDDLDVQRKYFPEAPVEIAEVCLQCSDPTYLGGGPISITDFNSQLEHSPFLSYAAKNWGRHVFRLFREKDDMLHKDCVLPNVKPVEDRVIDLLRQEQFLRLSDLVLFPSMDDLGGEWRFGQRNEPILAGIHVLTYFRLHEIMDRWIEAGNDPDLPTKSTYSEDHGFSALWQACQARQEDTALFLIKRGANPCRENCVKRFVLNAAAHRGLSEVVKYIIDSPQGQRCVKQYDASGRSPLIFSIISDYEAKQTIFKMIFDTLNQDSEGHEVLYHRSNNDGCAIHEAARCNQHTMIRMLVNAKGGKDHLDQRGSGHWQDTPLHIAAYHAKLEATQTLIDLGANTAARQSQGKTPLNLAIQQGYSNRVRVPVIKLLLAHSDPFIVDNEGRNYVHVAADCGMTNNLNTILECLPRQTAEQLLKSKNKHGETPLVATVRTCRNGWKECFSRCLEEMVGIISEEDARIALRTKKLEISIRVPNCIFENLGDPWKLVGDDPRFILHRFIETGSLNLVKKALEDVGVFNSRALDSKDSNGYRPLIVAIRERREDIVRCLLGAGADLNARDDDNKTALHHAVEHNAPLVAKLLVTNANLNLKDKSGCTPLSRCSRYNDCLAILVKPSARAGPEIKQEWKECERVKSTSSIWSITAGHDKEVESIRQGRAHVLGHIAWDFSTVPIHVYTSRYLVSDRIPLDARLPLSRIHVIVEGRDQGWSKDKYFGTRPEGSFSSDTRYALGIERNDTIVLKYEWAINKHRSKEPHTFECSWYVKSEYNDRYFAGRRSSSPDEQSRFLKALQLGDRVAVIAEAGGSGWMNITKRAEWGALDGQFPQSSEFGRDQSPSVWPLAPWVERGQSTTAVHQKEDTSTRDFTSSRMWNELAATRP